MQFVWKIHYDWFNYNIVHIIIFSIVFGFLPSFLSLLGLMPRGGGVLSPFDGGGVRPEKKYRGVRELLFIPKKGGLENWNKHRPKAVMREGVSPSCKGGLVGLTQKFCVI